MTYSSNHTNKATIFDSGDAIEGDHVKAIYDELGADPSGTFSTVVERLNDVDNRINAPVTEPPSDVTIPAVPTGYTENLVIPFTTVWKTADGSYFDSYNIRQGGGNTRSWSPEANVSIDGGVLRLRSTAEDYNTGSGTLRYTSGYIGTAVTGTEAQKFFPLFGRYQFLVKYPMSHGHWNGVWINYRGSASSGFEIDLAEQFNAQTPGRVGLNNHRENPARAITFSSSTSTAVCPYAHADAAWIGRPISGTGWPANTTVASVIPGTSFTTNNAPTSTVSGCTLTTPYGTNHMNASSGIGQITHYTQPSSTGALWSGTTAATYYGKTIDFDNPKGVGTTHHSDWHLLEVEVSKVDGSSGGWTILIDYWIDSKKVASWLDTTCNHLNGGRPTFIDHSLDQDYAWDMRLTSWVGGQYQGQVDTSTANDNNGGTRVLTYSGLGGAGTSTYMYADDGTVPDLDLFTASESYYLDCAWIRIVTKDAVAPPVGRTLLFNANVNGTDEADLTTGVYGTGGFEGLSSTGTKKHDTAQYINAGGNTTSIRHNIATGTESWMSTNPADAGLATIDPCFGRMYFRFDSSLPPANMYLLLGKDNAATTNLISLRWLVATSTLTLYNGIGGTVIEASSVPIVAATWYRLEFQIDDTSNLANVRLYDSAGTLLDTIGGAYTGAAPGHIVWGPIFSANQTYAMWTDGHAIDKSDWIGPLA